MSFIGPHKPFAHLGRLAAWQAGDTPAPVTVEIDLSNVCSLGCQSCHFAHTHVAGPWASRPTAVPPGFSSTGRFAGPWIFDALDDLAQEGVCGVVWSGGGEPTLHPEFDLIVAHAADAGLQQGMYTLGGHISEDRADLLRQALTWVVVSLDAADGPTYAHEKGVPASRFDDACAGIQRLSGGPCAVGVSFLLHATNWPRTTDMLYLARSLGATYATFRPTIDTDTSAPATVTANRAWVTDALPTLEALAAEPDVEIDPPRFVEYRDWAGRDYRTCYGIRLVTMVTPDGRVWVCPNRRGMDGSELGSLAVEPFSAIWARHPGQWTDFADCRAMCRLHLVNRTLAPVFAAQRHEAFV